MLKLKVSINKGVSRNTGRLKVLLNIKLFPASLFGDFILEKSRAERKEVVTAWPSIASVSRLLVDKAPSTGCPIIMSKYRQALAANICVLLQVSFTYVMAFICPDKW